MNRTALCIQMLNLLKSRGLMSREALAAELQTNIRNISEFRKELEMAGYYIESISGKYGGYQLMENTLLVVPRLDTVEEQALQEAALYLKSHPDFRYQKTFQAALDKINAGTYQSRLTPDVYLREQGMLSEEMQELLGLCEQAIQTHYEIILNYKSMRYKRFETVRMHPYEILHYQHAYYCLGYSLKAKDYRIYKFSEERMQACTISNNRFTKDTDFRLRDYIGEGSLIKGQIYELELEITGEEAYLIAEQPPGMHHQMKWVNEETLYCHLFMEGEVAIRMFLLSLGEHVKILAPRHWQLEIKRIIKMITDKQA